MHASRSSEEAFLDTITDATIKSLRHLKPQDQNNYFFVLSDRKAMRVSYGAQWHNGKPPERIESIEEFLRTSSNDPACLGIVPVTETAYASIHQAGYQQHTFGVDIIEFPYAAVMYRKQEQAAPKKGYSNWMVAWFLNTIFKRNR